ncbi:putative ankyrin repeat protein RF_0381 [Cloeon dipterum]|uniref:putative ankyrin repeat protein RF_0381 n=1 Tax=Cloeon dipterum TaxID=197152 RepID=UPI00322067AA
MKLRYVEENKGVIPALHFAARVSDVDVCRRLVEQGADVMEKYGVQDATPLHYAAMNAANGYSLIDFFLEKGCDIQARDARHDRAIEYAIRVGNYKLAMQIHMHFRKRYFGEATIVGALQIAILNKSLDFAKFVYNNKRQELLSERPCYFSILEMACVDGDLEMFKWLLEEVKIDVNQFEDKDWKYQILETVARNESCETSEIIRYLSSRFEFTADEQSKAYRDAFYYKIVNEDHQIFFAKDAEELFKGFADTKIQYEGVNWLQYCVSWGNLDAAKFVHGKDGELINEIDEKGATILHRAARHGKVEMCQWMIDQGQDINALNQKTGANFLHYAAQNPADGKNIIKTFGENLRGYVNQRDVNDFTPLHFAMLDEEYFEKSVAEALLELGADLSAKKEGHNLLHLCIVTGDLERVIFVHFKDKNLIKERGGGGKTTLHIAADHYHYGDICAWLVEEGLDPEEVTVGGKTVLESTSNENAKWFLNAIKKYTFF